MFIVLAIYSVAIIGLWLLFGVSRIHSYKFKDYSRIITPVTRIMAILFAVLTIVGYVSIFWGFSQSNSGTNSENTNSSEETRTQEKIIEENKTREVINSSESKNIVY